MANSFELSRSAMVFLVCEAICILFYGLFTEYGEMTSPKSTADQDKEIASYLQWKYPLFQDVHVMIFVGFGFLMVFLKNNSWCSIGFNYLIACWAIQIAILFTGFWHNIVEFHHDPNHEWKKIQIKIDYLFLADFAAGAVLISFGAILGKCSLFQLWAMATLEVFFYCINEAIVVEIFKIYDIGGSIVIHTFGAFFGLSVTLFYQSEDAIQDKGGLNAGNYLSDLVSMVGTIFLFAYWPSFNGAIAAESTYMHRATINTYLSISCSVIAAIVISKFVHGGKLNMEIVLNASLAGGVAVGSACDIIVTPAGSMIAGFIVGSISAYGFAFISPFVKKHLLLHDTCGVLNLHGIPGVIGALISAIVAYRAGTTFGEENLREAYKVQSSREPYVQAGYQLAGLGVCLGIAIFGGLFTGFVTSRQWFEPPPSESLFDDKQHWINCVIEHEELHSLKSQMSVGTSLKGNSDASKSTTYVALDRKESQNVRMQPNTAIN